MLASIRSIVSGRVVAVEPPPNEQAELTQFSTLANGRWRELSAELPENSPSRFPDGSYEMGLALIRAQNSPILQDKAVHLGNVGLS